MLDFVIKRKLENLKVQANSNANAASLSFVELAKNGTFDESTILEHSDMFLEYEVGINYKLSDMFSYEGDVYYVLQNHQSQEQYKPNECPALYKKIGDPTEEYPEWSRPISSGDAYMKGDKCKYTINEVVGHYSSTIDNNVWSPEEYPAGWHLDY